MLKLLAIIGYILLAVIILLCWVIIIPRSIYVEYTQKEDITVKIRIFIFKLQVYPWLFTKKDKGISDVGPQEDEIPPDLPVQDGEGDNIPNSDQDTKHGDMPLQMANGEKRKWYQGKNASKAMEEKPIKDNQGKDNKNQEDKKAKRPEKDKKDYFQALPHGFELVKTVLCVTKGIFRILLRGIKFKDICFTVPLKSEDAYETQQLYGRVTGAFYAFNAFLQRYVKISYKNPVFLADFANIYENSVYFYCKIQASPSIIIVVGWYLFKTYRKLTKINTDNTDKEK